MVKRFFDHNLISRIAPQLCCSRNPSNIRNPLIYCVNRYFLIFGGSQVQKLYRASTNSFLTFWPWCHIHYYRESYPEALWHYVCLNLQNVNCWAAVPVHPLTLPGFFGFYFCPACETELVSVLFHAWMPWQTVLHFHNHRIFQLILQTVL